MDKPLPTIAILGASGLIGESLAVQLTRAEFPVVPIARRFTAAQRAGFGTAAIECPIVALSTEALAKIFAGYKVDIVVNCIGVLQDKRGEHTETVHRIFTTHLLAALGTRDDLALLVHLSISGNSEDDPTLFSQTKREGERVIMAGSVPYLILRPGFVVAPSAYGGSALMRAIAALPFDLPVGVSDRPFAATDVADIGRTIAFAGRRWHDGERGWHAVWDVMERRPSTVGDVIESLRRWLGGPKSRLTIPVWFMEAGARAGDLIAQLGWSPPIRSTALRELQRGVTGDPEPWTAATGIEPAAFDSVLQRLPNTVQEKWFARLYLIKPLILASLAGFWIISGLIALISFDAATAILTSHGFGPMLGEAVTAVSSVADIAVGFAISVRRTCRAGLWAGIALSLFYMAGAAIVTPDLWIDPLGALVKTLPAIVLVFVGLATLESR
jgi:nucleoside-diphosphate-sugar epimerase